jgi:hypothetical protein
MTQEAVKSTITVNAPVEVVFDVLADPSTHEAIDGTGWVRQASDPRHITEVGQIFRMGMYHDNHPAKHYEMANRVEVLDRPRAIAWQPGSGPNAMTSASCPDGNLEYGGWIWRYDLERVDSESTAVTLSYDWSQVPSASREQIGFPPFELEHLDNSLKNLAGLAEERVT